MGFLRGTGLVIVCVLLFVALLCSGIFLTLGLSLKYENVQPQITSVATTIVEEQIGTSQIEVYLPQMQEYCKDNPDYVFSEGGYAFSLSCADVPNSTEEFIGDTVEYLTKDFYYKEYSCKFWDCFEEEDVPLFLVSKHAQNYWLSKFYTFLIFSLVLIGLLILLAKKKANGIILTGSLLFVVSLIVLKLNTIGTKIAGALMSPVAGALSGDVSQEILSDVVGIFFSASSKVFVWMFVIGLILIAGGIVLRLMGVGFKIAGQIEKVKSKVSREKGKKKK